MTENETRRQALLNEARQQSHSGMIPAVHPRYHASYKSIYPQYSSGEEKKGASSFYIRLVLALCLFFLFLLCDYKKVAWNGIDTYRIQEEIQSDEGWKEMNRLLEPYITQE